MSPRHYLIPSVLVSILIRRTPSVTHMFVFVFHNALMPGNKAIGPTGLAPSTVLVLRALQLGVPWVRPAALRALRRGPFRTVKECDLVQQAKLLARVPDLPCDLLLNEHLDLAPPPIGASSLSMSLVTTGFAPPPLWLGAILPDVSMLLTIEALDPVASLVHEDRHFYWSSTSWCKGHGLWGVMLVGDDWWVKHAPHLHLKGVVQSRPLDAVHAVDQVALDDEILFLSVRYSLPGILENISQGLLYLGFAPIPV